MKHLIFKISGFLSLPIVAVSICMLIADLGSRKAFSLKQTDTPIHGVFIGDSHIVAAIDDKYFKNCINLGRTSEALYFSYFRLKGLIESNPDIKNVYLGFGYHTLSSYYDDFFDGAYSNAVSSRYFFLVPNKEKLKLIRANKDDLLGYLKASINNGFSHVLYGNMSDDDPLKKNAAIVLTDTVPICERIRLQYYNGPNQNGFSSRSLEALIKIRDLCKINNIALTLIGTPVYELYNANVPGKFKEKYHKIPDSLKIELLDLSNLKMEPGLFMPDGDHVNNKGKVVVSEYLAKQLK